MNEATTNRGFTFLTFKDHYGHVCSVQESSLASPQCIWVGIDDPDPQILCYDAPALGLTPASVSGWMPYPLPEEVSLTTRMHLTREQAGKLAIVLQTFADTGNVKA